MADIANKGEAERCRDMAKEFLAQRHYEKAIKFFEKSLRLYPLPGIAELITRVESLSKAEQSAGSSSNRARTDGGNSTNSTGSNAGNAGSTNSTSSGKTERPYTDEQEAGAKKVLALFKKSHYEALGVSKSSNESEVKKAYRKLALKFHPDKNSAPSAENAFKALNAAFECLSDSRKKEIYDAYGAEASEKMSHDDDNGRATGFQGFRRGGFQHAEMSPEDLFNMFFHGMPTGAGGTRMRFNRAQQPQQERREGGQRAETNPLQQLLQLLPILLLILMSLSNFGGSPQPVFSLHQQPNFPVGKSTSTLGANNDIPYFVQRGFSEKYRPSSIDLRKVERAVEAEYAEYLGLNCLRERERKVRNLSSAKRNGQKLQIEEINKQDLPNCNKFKQMFGNDIKYRHFISGNFY